MLPGPQGLEAAPGFAQRLLNALPENWLSHQQLELDFLELNPPLDSSAMQPRHWFELAALVKRSESQADGILLLQGTDTLAWTAAALYWLLPDISCPLLLTAAQKPLNTPGSDALPNVQQALLWASQPGYKGVYVNFYHQLFDPRSCRKKDSQTLDAFSNPQGAPLAHFQQPLPQIQPAPRATSLDIPLSLNQLEQLAKEFEAQLLRLPLIPGLDAKRLADLTEGLDGLLLEGLGAGTSPPLTDFYAKLKNRPVITAMLSQCWSGGVSQVYAASAEAQQAGVLFLGRCTPENAQAALTWLLALRQLNLIAEDQVPKAWQLACDTPL